MEDGADQDHTTKHSKVVNQRHGEETSVHVGEGCNYWWLLAAISLILGSAGIVAIAVVETSVDEHVYVYGIVFDAGSTHTAMFLYKWEGDKVNGTAEVKQVNSCRSKSLSSFESDPSKAGDALTNCLDTAEKWIPKDKQSVTEVYLGATAGMRLINVTNPTASDAIFKSVRKTISSYPFGFSNPDQQARIINGSEEGTFSWITINYFSGTLGVHPVKLFSSAEPPTPVTHGALDMGGASTQITFTPRDRASLPDNYSARLRLYGVNHTVYTHSYLCYGINEAVRRFQAQLVLEQSNKTTILDPCGPRGNVTMVSHDDVFEAPCSKGPHALEAFGSEIFLEEDVEEGLVYSFEGQSDPEQCLAQTTKLFNFNQDCNYSRCSFSGKFQPPVSGDFYAFSSFFYQVQFLNLTDGNSSFTLSQFREAITALCNSTWDQVKFMHTNFPAALPLYCFETNFVLTLLSEGYGFNSTNWNSLQFKEKVNNADLGWALGFMINTSNFIPAELPESPIALVTVVLLLVLFVVFLAIAIGFAYYAAKHHNTKSPVYERMGSGTYGAV